MSHLQIKSALRVMTKSGTTNMVDLVLKMMEKQAVDLEDTARNREKQLQEEIRRTDDLLSKMLPQCVHKAM